MNLYDEFFAIVRRLQQQQIDYAVVGGIALALHNLPRLTKDIDILVGHEAVHQRIIKQASEEPWPEGVVRYASREDLSWMKRQRNSDQDQVDIKRLEDDQDRAGDVEPE